MGRAFLRAVVAACAYFGGMMFAIFVATHLGGDIEQLWGRGPVGKLIAIADFSASFLTGLSWTGRILYRALRRHEEAALVELQSAQAGAVFGLVCNAFLLLRTAGVGPTGVLWARVLTALIALSELVFQVRRLMRAHGAIPPA
jgi:hypothetical protein